MKTNAIKYIPLFLFLLLAGRLYQFMFFEPPFRAFLFNTGFMKPFIEGVLKIEWTEWVTNPIYEARVNMLLNAMGLLLALTMVAVVFFSNRLVQKINPFLMITGSVVLLITSFGYYWDKSTQIGQFWEYSLQFGLPVIFLLFLKGKDRSAIFVAKLFSSLTFTAHGLYAIGFYPVPGEFVQMTSTILGITDEPAKAFLKIAGVLDFVFGVAIWIPKIQKPALLYGAVWGFATAFARVYAFYFPQFALLSLHQTVFECLVRLPHGAVPLLLFLKTLTQKDMAVLSSFLPKLKIKNQNNEIPKSI